MIETSQFQSKEKISKYGILVLLVLLIAAFIPIVKSFVIPLVLATAFSALFYPLYKRVLGWFRHRRGVSALVSCLILFLGVALIVFFLVNVVIQQAVDLYHKIEPTLRGFLAEDKGNEFLDRIKESRGFQLLAPLNVDWGSAFQKGAQKIAALGAFVVNKSSIGLFDFLLVFFVTFLFMFYFFMDGDRFMQKLKSLTPLRHEYKEMLVSRFLLISRSTIKGTLLIGIFQGGLGALTFLILGIKTWLLWGFVMIVFSIIPVLGPWLIMVPAALIQLFTGHMGKGIALLIVSIIISILDNVIRPRVVGQNAKMHDLFIFISTLGGITAFGPMGFIIGPIIAAMFLATLDMYATEFQPQLSALDKPDDNNIQSI